MRVLTWMRRHPAAALAVVLVFVLAALLAFPPTRSVAQCELGTAAFRRGLALHERDRSRPNPYLDQALRHYQQAVSSDPGNAYAWRKLCDLYLLLGQNELAKGAIDSALSLRPDNGLYHILLGDAYDGLGLPAEAIAEWTIGQAGAWRLDQTVVNYTKLADAHIQSGDPMSALPILEGQVLPLDPTNLFALVTIVSTYDSAVGGQHPLANAYRAQLATLTPDVVRTSADERYGAFQARAVIELYRLGYWSQAQTEVLLRHWEGLGYGALTPTLEGLRAAAPGAAASYESAWGLPAPVAAK